MIDPQTRGRITRKAKTNELVKSVNALLNMQGRDGIRVTVSDTNVLITLDQGDDVIAQDGPRPWGVQILDNGVVSIAPRSRLYSGLPLRTLRTITNYNPTSTAATVLSLSTAEDNFIGIELTLSSAGAITAASIVSTNLSGYVANSFYRLTGSAPIYVDRVLIPLAILGDGAIAAQLARTHLRLTTWVHNGYIYQTALPS